MQILGVDVLYIAGATVGWLTLSYLFWVLVARPMFKKWVKGTILLMVTEPDEDTKRAINSLFTLGWNWFLTPVNTGRTVKQTDDEGNSQEVPEVQSPYQQMIGESTRILFMKFKGMKGGDATKLAAELSGITDGNPLGLSPAAMKALLKGQIGPAVMEVGMPKLMELLNKKKDDINTGGGKW